eukprot:391742-Pyramimonas_sp.AAC.1
MGLSSRSPRRRPFDARPSWAAGTWPTTNDMGNSPTCFIGSDEDKQPGVVTTQPEPCGAATTTGSRRSSAGI